MPILTEDERIGTQLGDRYALKGILGRGGMGVVYDAEHTYTGRRVAVKLLRPEVSEDPKRAERLMREARAAAALDHPGIVDVLDMGEVDGCLYLALEHLEGRDLGAELSERGTLGVEESVEVVVAVLDALAAAHAEGIVHRDIKPSNIFLARKDSIVPKVLDFGIARSADADGMTTTGTIIGTPWYMSPEAAAGDQELGPDADVWAAAVVLYECLSGKRPFEGKSATGVLMNVLRKDAEPLALDDAPEVAEVVNRALSKGKDRIRDAAELASELRNALDAEGTTGTSPMPAVTQTRGPWMLALGVVALLLVVGGVGWAMRSEPEPVEMAAHPASEVDPLTDAEGERRPTETVAEERTPNDTQSGQAESTMGAASTSSASTMTSMASSNMGSASMATSMSSSSSSNMDTSAMGMSNAPSTDNATDSANANEPLMVDVRCREGGSRTARQLRPGEWLRINDIHGTPIQAAFNVPASVPRAITRCYRNTPIGGWMWILEIDRNGVIETATPVRHCPDDERVLGCVEGVLVGTDIGEVDHAGRARLGVSVTSGRPRGWSNSRPSTDPELRTTW